VINYRNFGFIRENKLSDVYRWLFGYPNLMKRLQARDIIQALDLKSSDRVLDIGCAYGVFTIEMAKVAGEAIGVDVNPPRAMAFVPKEHAQRLKFIATDARTLPFADGYFDVVLASEVLMMIEDPAEFLREISRVLKPGGRLVAVNGTGHLALQSAYASNSRLLRVARWCWPKRFPKSYDDYAERLRAFFGTAFPFRSREYYRALLAQAGFPVQSELISPRDGAAAAVSWTQFLHYVRTGQANPSRFFATKYCLFGFLGYLRPSRALGGQILVACNDRGQ
jgi:ubiquinone/menaquinone biosynthesis C-methylase UbiE